MRRFASFQRNFAESRRFVVVFAALMVTFGAASMRESLRPRDEFMAQKKVYTQEVLDGLMNEQFDAIIEAGEKMKLMRSDKRWDRYATEDYARFSHNFQKAAQVLTDAARQKNLDACMASYIDCLQSCYSCHKYVRANPLAKASFELNR